MRQMVAYKRLKTMENHQPSGPKSDRGRGGYSHILPIRVCSAQRGRDFEAPDVERGIHFRDVS